MKELKDYLHLYFGASIQYINYFGEGLLTGVLNGVHANHAWVEDDPHGIPFPDVQIFLRPLSDMTKEEKIERKKHFDLFGLIETGLAIDKSTL